jgi:sugar (pentulose or hexulose) kinase
MWIGRVVTYVKENMGAYLSIEFRVAADGDILGTVMVPKAGDSSFGAALLAGVGIGLFPDVRTAVERSARFEEPVPANHERYGRYFALYRQIHDALAPVEKRIHETFAKGK